jgi:hypothetical protein
MLLICIIKILVTCSDILCMFVVRCVVYQLIVNNSTSTELVWEKCV